MVAFPLFKQNNQIFLIFIYKNEEKMLKFDFNHRYQKNILQ